MDIKNFCNVQYDMLFCLGPLYHRIRESKKRKLISVINSPSQTRRDPHHLRLRPGGHDERQAQLSEGFLPGETQGNSQGS